MPNWRIVLSEIEKETSDASDSAADKVRRKYLMQLHAHVGRNVFCYYSGFLSKPSTIQGMEINDDDKNGLMLCVHGLDQAMSSSSAVVASTIGRATPSFRAVWGNSSATINL